MARGARPRDERWVSVLADYSTVEIYSDANCKSIPLVVTLEMTNTTCSKSDTCSAIEINNSSYYYAERCATDRFEYTSQLFSGAKYLMIDGFQEEGCESYARSNVFLAAGTCQLASYVGQRSEIATLFIDGSAYMTIYNDSACATKAQTYPHRKRQWQWLQYNDNDDDVPRLQDDCWSVVWHRRGCLAIVILPALLIYWKMRRSKRKAQKRGATNNRAQPPDVALAVSDKHENEERSDQRSTLSSRTGGSGQVLRSNELRCDPLRSDELRGTPLQRKDERKRRSDELRSGGSDRLKNERQRKERQRKERQRGDEPRSDRSDRDRMPSDPYSTGSGQTSAIHAQRLRGPVTADSVCEDDAILSPGTYEERAVAVKMLFPETRKSTRHVTEFLTEVKMMTVMDHPRVVEFIGVSWNNLMDLCVVTEFMAGGDLRAWLGDRADNDSPVGFDFTKVKIATHVVHALAYLHSLTPSVIHRDLKSRNILLSENQDAKLADFGASRERVDRTMTAGVGTSLWIAPEVMMGERYDDKADMFSLAAEPVRHAKDKNPTGRKMPETAILQLVAMGKLRVEFSPGALKGIVQLGTACTAIDPTERPSAAEAFRKLQTILAHEAKKAANAK
ncbi:Protein kinase-like domain [Phytophthora cactorum]|nr:Protein kinase-like domain [Phytophthora cactorum]